MKNLDDILDKFMIELNAKINKDIDVGEKTRDTVFKLFVSIEEFQSEAFEMLKGNLSAGTRARAKSCKVTSLLKQFRADTMEEKRNNKEERKKGLRE